MRKKSKYEQKLKAAKSALMQGAFYQAQAHAQKAHDIKPQEVAPLILMGDAYLNLGDDSRQNILRATNCFEEAVRLDSDIETAAYSRYARCLYESQEKEKAEEYYLFILSWKSDDIESLFDYGIFLFDEQKWDRAESIFQRIIGELIEQHNYCMRADVYQYLASTAQAQGLFLTAYHYALSALDMAKMSERRGDYIQRVDAAEDLVRQMEGLSQKNVYSVDGGYFGKDHLTP